MRILLSAFVSDLVNKVADLKAADATLQGAIDAAPAGRAKPWLIFVKNGQYHEHIDIPATKPNLHIIGQDRDKTVVLDNRITAMTGHQDNPGTGKTLAGDPAPVTEIADVAKAMGYKKVVKVWMPAATGTMFPPLKIPENKRYLPAFAWFDYLRPKDKDDIFIWRGKDEKDMLKKTEQKKMPIQSLDNIN